MLHCGLDMAACLDRCDGSRFRDRYVFCIAIEGSAVAEHEAVAAMGSVASMSGDFLFHIPAVNWLLHDSPTLSGWR